MRSLAWAVAACAAFGWMVPCEAREWLDKSGTYKVEAELVEVRDGKVLLRKQDGNVISVPLDRLSDRDRQFLRQQSAPVAGGKPADASPVRVEVQALSVTKPMPKPAKAAHGQDAMMFGAGGMPGTELTLLLTTTKTHILGVDEDASRLTRFADDKGTVLASGEPGRRRPFGWPRVRPDGRLAIVSVRADATPSPGATRLLVQGELVVRCGEGEKTVESDEVDLKTGGKLTLGTTTVTIKQDDQGGPGFRLRPMPNKQGDTAKPGSGATPTDYDTAAVLPPDAPMSVTLSASSPLDLIKSVTFLGPDGKAIKHHRSGSMSMGVFGHMEYSITYALERQVPKLKLKVVHFERVVSVKVPLALETGLGL